MSKLGAEGQPYAIWWNLIGFLWVGLLLAAFGYSYGRVYVRFGQDCSY